MAHWITPAERTIDIAIYLMTSAKIARAIKEAHERGVTVRVLMDKTQAAQRKFGLTSFLDLAGVPVYLEAGAGAMHNKYTVIDGETVLTGSFNYTGTADERNDENLVIIHGRPTIAKAYTDDFAAMLTRAKRYQRP